jgi:hypothetical protein
MKSRGERGNPCRVPLPTWKKYMADPLRIMEKETKFKQTIIQLKKLRPKPRWISSILMYNQFTLSKALHKSNFITTALNLLVLMVWRSSCATTIASCIFLPSKKLNYSPEMCFERMTFNLLLMTLEIILYRKFHSDMGQKSLKAVGLSVLGINAMKVALIGLCMCPICLDSSITHSRSGPRMSMHPK